MKKFLLILFLLLIGFLAWKGRDILTNLQTSLFGSPAMQTETESGLVGYWKMNYEGGEVKDYSRNDNHGTITGATAVPGKVGSALDFNGSTNKVATSMTSNTAFTSGFTISAWIKPETLGESSLGQIVNKRGSSDGFSYGVDTNNKLTLRSKAGGSASSANDAITLGRWQHVLITVASDGVTTHYVNGTQSGIPADAGDLATYTNSNPLTIGALAYSSAYYFDGAIDEIHLYNRGLSPEEITQLYREGNRQVVLNTDYAESNGLIAHYPLAQEDLLSATVIADKTSNGNNGTITPGSSAGFVTDSHGVVGRAYDFDGSATKIDTGSDWLGTDTFTMSVWIKPDATENNDYLISNGKFLVYFSNNYALGLSNVGVEGSAFYGSGNRPSLTAFTHYVIIRRDDGTTTVYQNGVSQGVVGNPGTPEAGTTNVIIGNASAGNKPFDGAISDLRVYNRALSTDEITELYHSYRPDVRTPLTKGLVSHWPLNRDSLTYGPNLITNSTFESDLSNWTNGGASTYERNTTNPINGTGDLHWVADVGGGYLGVQSDSMSFTSGKNYQTSFLYKKGSGSTLHWNMATSSLPTINNVGGFASADLTATSITEYSGNTTATATTSGKLMFYNTSGQAGEMYVDNVSVREADAGLADLTPNGNLATYSSVSIGGDATEFDGDTSVISAASGIIGTGDVSVSAWVYANSKGEGNIGRIIDNGQFRLQMYTGPRFLLRSDYATSAISDVISLGEWVHVVATRNSDGSQTNFYVNGSSSGTANQDSGTPGAGGSTNIGNTAGAGAGFDGYISDVRIWDRVLSATEVTELYSKGRPKSTVNYAANVTDVSQYFSLADSGSAGSAQDLDMGLEDFMLETWVKIDSAGADYQGFIRKRAGLNNSAGYYFGRRSGGNSYLAELDDGAGNEAQLDIDLGIADDAWHHIALRADRDGTMGVCRDGTFISSASISAVGNIDNTTELQIASPGSGAFDGEIAKVRIYKFGVGGMPDNIANLIQRNASNIGKIDSALQPYFIEGWDLNSDGFAINTSSRDLTNNGSTEFVKVK